jgi:hypothetical protein
MQGVLDGLVDQLQRPFTIVEADRTTKADANRFGRICIGTEGCARHHSDAFHARKTRCKIFDRYKEHGLEALTDRSRRPSRG